MRILAVEQLQALPFATKLLGALGADVVKVEVPGLGEAARSSQPSLPGPDGRTMSTTYMRSNSGKRSLALDWKTEAGRRLLLRLLPRFDIFAENYRPGALDALGLGFKDLVKVHPRLVYASVTGFGQNPASPYYSWGAMAPVAEAMAGFYQSQINRGEPPKPNFAGPLGDTIPALYAAIGLLAALNGAQRTGVGQHVDVSMLDAMVTVRDYTLANWSLGESDELIGFVQPFRASDGWLVLVVIRPHQFKRLAELIGREEWLLDPAIADPRSWVGHAPGLIIPAIEQWAAHETRASAAAKMAAVGLAIGPCLDNADLVADPHIRLRDTILPIQPAPGGGVCYVPGNPIKIAGAASAAPRNPPTVGQDTVEVLRTELDLSDQELDDLLAAGVIGSTPARVAPD